MTGPPLIQKATAIGRRRFLAIVGVALAASAGVLAWYRRTTSRVFGAIRLNELSVEQDALDEVEGQALEKAIHQYYRYLTLDAAGVKAFVTAHQASRYAAESGERERKETLDRYLLSTDFFLHGADETRTVRFVAFHDPYTSPCINPFA